MGYPNENVFCAIVNVIEAKWPIEIPITNCFVGRLFYREILKLIGIYLISSIAVRNYPALAM
jgi:hypothetical protein